LKEDFSVLIVGGSGSRIRTVPAPKLILGGLVALSVVGIVLLTVFCVGLWKLYAENSAIDKLSTENTLLKRELQTLNRQLTALEQRWLENVELEDRMRLQADLPEVDDETRMMGVGGPSGGFESLLSGIDGYLASTIVSIRDRADQLIRQCDYQRASYLQIIEALSENQQSWDRIPSISPIREGRITSGYGRRKDPFTKRDSFHEGVDYSARRGTPIFATADGRVMFTGKKKGYGLTLRINHGNGIETVYAHNLDMLVKRGQKVERGQIIARVGNSGRSTAPHLHYEVRVNGKSVNPLTYILPEEVVVD
jgi:murein DD-endopeptidase MepM/ murein hydrolase activator NlpD